MTQTKRKGLAAATTRPRPRKGTLIKKLVRSIARNWADIKTGFGLLVFLLMIGTVGGMENDMLPLDVGFGIIAVCILAMWFLAYTSDDE